jgi:hypothetical protein
MRFTKAEVIEAFDPEDMSYRLAILCTYWPYLTQSTAIYADVMGAEERAFAGRMWKDERAALRSREADEGL